jgi:hypothetical protein
MEPINIQFTLRERSSQGSRRLPLRVNNVARRLCKPERTVRHLASTNKIPAFKVDGKSWGFWPEDVDLYRSLLEAQNAEGY